MKRETGIAFAEGCLCFVFGGMIGLAVAVYAIISFCNWLTQ